jgi:hypothetical protein
MKNFKWFLTVTSAIVALILTSCAPGILTIASVTENIVEVTANSTDTDLSNLASWCRSKGILMLWYDFDDQPDGFDSRSMSFQVVCSHRQERLSEQRVSSETTTQMIWRRLKTQSTQAKQLSVGP